VGRHSLTGKVVSSDKTTSTADIQVEGSTRDSSDPEKKRPGAESSGHDSKRQRTEDVLQGCAPNSPLPPTEQSPRLLEGHQGHSAQIRRRWAKQVAPTLRSIHEIFACALTALVHPLLGILSFDSFFLLLPALHHMGIFPSLSLSPPSPASPKKTFAHTHFHKPFALSLSHSHLLAPSLSFSLTPSISHPPLS
jgi:hypothetical protein